MPVTINGTTGITTPAENAAALTVGSITGILKATSGVVSQAVAGTDYLTSTSGGAITLGTAQTASGTAVDFTGIPSWVKRITVMFNGVSTTAGTEVWVRIGSGSFDATGYTSSSNAIDTGASISASNSGYVMRFLSSTNLISGQMIIQKLGSNVWISSHTATAQGVLGIFGAGLKTLSGTLDRLQIIPNGGNLDAGTINISYEG